MINAIARFIATAEVPDDIQVLGRPLLAAHPPMHISPETDRDIRAHLPIYL